MTEDMWEFLNELDGMGEDADPTPVFEQTTQPPHWCEWDEAAPREPGSECYLTDVMVRYVAGRVGATGHKLCPPTFVPTHFIFRISADMRSKSVRECTCVACARTIRSGTTHVRGMHVDCFAVLRMSESCVSGW